MAGVFPEDLADLFKQLGGRLADGASQPDILQWLFDISKAYGFRMRYDEYTEAEYNARLVEERREGGRELSQAWVREQHEQPPPAAGIGVRPPGLISFEEYPAEAGDGGEDEVGEPEVAAGGEDAAEVAIMDIDEAVKTDPFESYTGIAYAEREAHRKRKQHARLLEKRERQQSERGIPVAIQVRKGRLFVCPDPAVREPRDPPNAEAATAQSAAADPKSWSAFRDEESPDEEPSTPSLPSHAAGESAPFQGGGRPASVFDYLTRDNLFVGRVLLYRESRGVRAGGAYRSRQIEYEFGSLTIDMVTGRPLAITPRPFVHDARVRDVDLLLREGVFEIMRINDGTVGTLYNWHHPRLGPIWAMATARGYDVFPYYWSGELTWAEALFELLQEEIPGQPGKTYASALGATFRKDFLCEGDTRIDFAHLSPDRGYTIGFRNHRMQPLLHDPQAVWNIQSTDLRWGSDFQPSFDPGLGVPAIGKQVVCSGADIEATIRGFAGFDMELDEYYAKRTSGGAPFQVDLHTLRLINKTSIPVATKAIAEDARGFDKFLYGYILRSGDVRRSGQCSDIMADSPLLLRIRDNMYRKPRNADSERLLPQHRMAYNALRAMLTPGRREGILELYPQFKELDRKSREFLNNVQHYVLEKARRSAANAAGGEKKQGKPSPTACLGNVVFDAIIEANSSFNGFELNVADVIVNGYLYDACNALFILTVLGYK
jgi:hypothetical protein